MDLRMHRGRAGWMDNALRIVKFLHDDAHEGVG